MTSESFGNDIEIGVEKPILPEQLKGISNEKDFINVYSKIKSWYGENFSDNEFSIIKEIRNRGCKEYGGQFNTTRLAILGNRIDTGIFEFKYTNFINIDKNIIRKISDTNRQRKFREVAIKLIKKYNSLFDSDIKIIESEFKNEFNNKKTPNFDIISEKINKNKGNQNNNETISTNENINNNNLNTNSTQGNYNDLWPSDADVESMLNLKISPFFEEIKKEIFKIESFDNNGNKKYLEGFFNKCADEVSELYGNIENYSDIKEELLPIFKQHLFAISQGIEKSSTELTKDIKEKIMDFKPEDSLAILSDNVFDKDDKTDYSKYTKSSELTQEDKDTIKFLVNKLGGKYTEQEVTNNYYKYKYLELCINDGKNLSEKEKKDYKGLKELFQQTGRLKKLEEVKNLELSKGREYKHKSIYSSVEYATGNMRDIKPAAIVENNKKINEYVYGNKETQEELDVKNIKISDGDKTRLFKILKEQKESDPVFQDTKEFLNDDLTINEELANLRGMNIESVKDNVKRIENMIKDLAVQERLEKSDKETIKNINIRRSAMICCFRAISSLFDTASNGENFASEFEIADVNKNIEFNEDTGVITMSGTIGPNKNHIKLYYHTQSGILEFDDFFAYDDEEGCYKIGKGNGKREKIKEIKLPTMDKMEETAKSVEHISHNLIDKLSFNKNQYDNILGFAMTESIWLNCFRGLMGNNIEAGSTFVEKFNEKNILKQDIIKNIYKKFYDENSLDDYLNNDNKCLEINKGNKPEQFELIELIYNSIKHYNSTNQLFDFRNCVNQLDGFLSSKDTIKKDGILTEFFGDDLSNDNDAHDNTIEKIKQENGFVKNDNDQNTYKFNGNNQKQIKQGGHGLNYYNFLNLLTEDVGGKRIINLHDFKNILEIIGKDDYNLENDASATFKENYEKYEKAQTLSILEGQMDIAYGKA